METTALKFPFLGSLENGEPFQYILASLDADKAEIALLQWFLNRQHLHIGDKINLHLPEQGGDISGTVTAAENNDAGQTYQVSLINAKHDYVIMPKNTASLTDLVIHRIKDTMILKSGIRVYFKHLIPYFSRISDYSYKEYQKLQVYFLHDIEKRIIDNEAKLEKLYQMAQEKITKPEEIPVYLDLEPLREIIESEISSSVFSIVFSQEQDSELPKGQMGTLVYINAIKILERRLYSNYNHIVLLYLQAMG